MLGSGEIARIVSSLSEVVAGTNRGVSRNVDQVGRMSSLAIDLNVLLDRFDYKESSAAPSPSKGASNGASKAARVASGAKPKARDLRPASWRSSRSGEFERVGRLALPALLALKLLEAL